jgi:hypothetical protein
VTSKRKVILLLGHVIRRNARAMRDRHYVETRIIAL